jgi:hypothetical protein
VREILETMLEACMAALVELGCIRKSGHVYHFIKNLP